MKKTTILLMVITAMLFCGCHRNHFVKESTNKYPNVMIEVPGAFDIGYISIYNGPYYSFQLTYKLNVKYPAKDVVDGIAKKLKEQGWEPMMESSFLNPDIPSSLKRGWENYPDASRKPRMKKFVWGGDWKDMDGNIITYGLHYSEPLTGIFAPGGEPSTTILHIFADYMTKSTADKMLNNVNKYTKK